MDAYRTKLILNFSRGQVEGLWKLDELSAALMERTLLPVLGTQGRLSFAWIQRTGRERKGLIVGFLGCSGMKFGVYCVVSRELFKVFKQGNQMIMMIQKDNSGNNIMKHGLESQENREKSNYQASTILQSGEMKCKICPLEKGHNHLKCSE